MAKNQSNKIKKRRQEALKKIMWDKRIKKIEEDCQDAPEPERRRQYLIGAFERLDEYWETGK